MSDVLIVEDNANQRLLYRMELEEEGHLVTEAVDGREALDRITPKAPDVIITDLVMPGVDGRELLNRIMAMNPIPHVIIYSAYEGFRDDYTTWAADAYLVKSSDLQPLMRQVHRLTSVSAESPPHTGRAAGDASSDSLNASLTRTSTCTRPRARMSGWIPSRRQSPAVQTKCA
jgi:CheY-like chemotaxis protein